MRHYRMHGTTGSRASQLGVLVITCSTIIESEDIEIPSFEAPEGFYAGAVVSQSDWTANSFSVCGKALFINPVTEEVISPSVHVPIAVTITKDRGVCVAAIKNGEVAWMNDAISTVSKQCERAA